jgi:hypothetical protein
MSILVDHGLDNLPIVCAHDVLCTLMLATVLLVVILNIELVNMTSHYVYINDLTNLPTMAAESVHFRNVKTVYCWNEDILLEYVLHAEVCGYVLSITALQHTLFCRELLFVSVWSSVSCHTYIKHCPFILNIRANVFFQ